MKLSVLIVADPLPCAAELLAEQCRRIAHRRIVVHTARELSRQAYDLRPEMVVFSLELPPDEPESVVKGLRQALPDALLMATFRELGVPRMEKLGRLGVDEFIAQPVDVTDVFRAASARFNVAFRRHDRFNTAIEVCRSDGVVLGTTINMSEGGMCLEVGHPLSSDTSIIVALLLPDKREPLRVRFRVLSVDGHPPSPVRVRGAFENLRGEEHRRLAGFLNTLSRDSGTT